MSFDRIFDKELKVCLICLFSCLGLVCGSALLGFYDLTLVAALPAIVIGGFVIGLQTAFRKLKEALGSE